MEQFSFWNAIRQSAKLDDSLEPPADVVNRVCAMMESRAPSPHWVFRLVPVTLGAVRSEVHSFSYISDIVDGKKVHMDVRQTDQGFSFQGMIEGIEDAQVFLYGDETTQEVPLRQGCFQYEGIAKGRYKIAIVNDREHYWIQELHLEPVD